MAEVLVQFETIVAGPNGSRWSPRACGRARRDGLWEGWIEFEPANPADGALRTSRESVQPNRDDLMYWAEGLTQTYLEGAMQRALSPTRVSMRRTSHATPRFSEPAASNISRTEPVTPRAVLNPFEVYEQGEQVLVQQLSALNAARLRDIAVEYRFATSRAAAGATAESLRSTILDGVRNRGDRWHRDREGPAFSAE